MAKSSKSLVIVESPTKARTLSRFLGKDFIVESSIGHIRDLPESASDIPPLLKKKPWARLGINIEEGFRPLYIIPSNKRKQVSKLKELLKKAGSLYLATDEDREGESISWHLCEVLKPKVPRRRLVFHEITREAIKEALRQPREIDKRLVKAQETRRIVDRLFGYEVSPVLWRKIRPRLSAGRVQSIAVRIIVERERDRIRFVPASYWDIQGVFSKKDGDVDISTFTANLISLGGQRLAVGKDFQETGNIRPGVEARILKEKEANQVTEHLRSASWNVVKVERRPYTDRPAPPFTTSTLQQEANRKLRYSARQTMQIAQRLYENGHITYMRTDSTALSEQAIKNARNLIQNLYGPEYLSEERRQYKTSVKNAQEAHEAIRPAGERFELPEELTDVLDPAELKLYELIWKRTMACQMAEARGHRVVVQLEGKSPGETEEAIFQATGKNIEFAGYLRAYVEGADDPDAELADKEILLPAVEEGDPLNCVQLEPKGHSTQPPPRFTESSLIKELEQNGVGRPSTYATIIDTILRRDYVVKQGNALIPTFTALAVVGLLEKNFGRLVDTKFTARMEDDLDSISRGEKEPLPYLEEFYYGNGDAAGLKDLIKAEIDPRETCTIPLGKDSSGKEINIRIGRFGPYLERGDERANIPEGIAPDALTIPKAMELLEKGSGSTHLGNTPEGGEIPPGLPVYLRSGRYGPYVQLGESGESNVKMKSLLPGTEPSSATLESAIQLLSLPRLLGQDPESGEDVTADLGRYGQYVKRGREAATINPPNTCLDITLEQALQLLKEKPPGRRIARSGPTVLRELGANPQGDEPIRLMTGRYGPYVTNGKINASLRRDQSTEEMTLEIALELLRERAERGPARKTTRKKKKVASRKKKTK